MHSFKSSKFNKFQLVFFNYNKVLLKTSKSHLSILIDVAPDGLFDGRFSGARFTALLHELGRQGVHFVVPENFF